ncbi:MAG TPA: FAD-dependent oxidoreductase, partial [Anaerolineales bacterium]
MAYSNTVRKETLKSIADVSHMPFWLDDPSQPTPESELTKNISTDLLIISAGFTGLWTVFLAKEEDPSREVVIIEAGEVASGASGRNGGFMDASITHGLQNGIARWPKEFPALLALGITNLDEIESTIKSLGIECDYLRTGELSVASEPHQVQELKSEMELSALYDLRSEFYDHENIQDIIKSPL